MLQDKQNQVKLCSVLLIVCELATAIGSYSASAVAGIGFRE